jgi:hypothetical protein
MDWEPGFRQPGLTCYHTREKYHHKHDRNPHPTDRHDGLTCGLSILHPRSHHPVPTPYEIRRMDSPSGAIRQAMLATPYNSPRWIIAAAARTGITPVPTLYDIRRMDSPSGAIRQATLATPHNYPQRIIAAATAPTVITPFPRLTRSGGWIAPTGQSVRRCRPRHIIPREELCGAPPRAKITSKPRVSGQYGRIINASDMLAR